MPRELVTVQVGQCGNQIGCRFWELALREHAAHNTRGVYDEAISSFFRNVDSKVEPPRNLPVGDGRGLIHNLKARSVIVDMECGVIAEMLKGPLGEVLDTRAMVSDVSGAGNNWAHGHNFYGPQYRDALLDKLSATAEECDSLQAFLVLHSLGGGTGSGVGSYLLEMLADEFPGIFRFSSSVFPSEDDDVVTSPYNALMACSKLVEHADVVLPLENQALMDICGRLDARVAAGAGSVDAIPGMSNTASNGPMGHSSKSSRPFDAMNGLAANMLLHLTASVRFEGSLNVDLNDITMNLVPYPRMQFLISAMSPLATTKDVARANALRSVDQMFSDVFAREHQLLRCDPRGAGTYLACGLIMRGASAGVADLNRNLTRIRPSLRMAHWASDGFKLGVCSAPPVGSPYALLCLANNTAMGGTLRTMRERFDKLYKRRFYTHHYEEYGLDTAGFTEAAELVSGLATQYADMETSANAPPSNAIRLRPRGLSFL